MERTLSDAVLALEHLPSRAGGSPLYATWEIRGVARGRGPVHETSVVDGGARVEWLDPRTLEVARARFLVGAAPGALDLLAREEDFRFPPGVAWERAVAELSGHLAREVDRFRRTFPLLEETVRAAGPGTRHVRWEVTARARAWRRPGEEPRRELSTGFRVTVRLAAGDAFARVAWAGSEPGRAPWAGPDHRAWVERLAGAREAAEARTRLAPLPPEPWEGPVVLLGSSAGWWGHEMGHAAIEGIACPGEGNRHGLRVLDDPRQAPWPAGFEVDDAGHAARPAVLWDAEGPLPVEGPGRLRREGIRSPAVPSLACTTVEAAGHGWVDWEDLPRDVPVVLRVDSGRLDLPGGTLLLGAADVMRITPDGLRPVAGSHLLTVGCGDGWRGARPVRNAPAVEGEQATCTRQGWMIAVMVGAPTVVLDPVRLLPRNGRKTRFPREMQ